MNAFFFVAWPYVAWVLAIVAGIYRYFTARYTYSSLSSEMLASRSLFWGSVSWHYGIIPILLAHLLAGVFPSAAAAAVSRPGALLGLEVVGLALAFLSILGIATLIGRRLGTRSPLRRETSGMDWVLLAVLALQVVTGAGIALFVRWGSRWYPYTAAPWFWSIVRLDPDPAKVAALPGFVQLHFVSGFLLIALFPFTRLVHLVTVPVTYLWRPYQIVSWLGRRGAGRSPMP
ncbi:respiratory nitrate reductase subunit gamma [Anaeromyxobacter oryzae]|uniref:Respiratory nitrate reductase subunit gamma n=1 Tax=Anaeromyxobacter oryzae TaxID=2918170 RepID=A0ABM7WS68_9BACT|nr:respiratory nitrate reductase subunit gamma [Anaeromyxobacter oryzae]BDG02317.1 respiratory nitrate reductase subunit gamma [Anaeromyxobacter oryzae]